MPARRCGLEQHIIRTFARGAAGSMKRIHNLNDFEAAARRRLPRSIFQFIEGAADDGVSRDANLTAFRQLRLVPRVLRNTSARSLRCQLLGSEWEAPFGVAPMGAMGVAGFQADLALARAARAAGIPF